MIKITAILTEYSVFRNWSFSEDLEFDREEGLIVTFPFFFVKERRNAVLQLRRIINENNFDWLFEQKNEWFLNLNELKNSFEELKKLEWLKGIIKVSLYFDKETPQSRIEFIVTKDEIIMSYPRNIFLSHKSSDKMLVRDFKEMLTQLGFDAWLDQDALHAGANLERALLQGFKDSCAAVFFVTPSFKDEKFLATEIDYAIAEKREKGERFAIITLVFKEGDVSENDIPKLLRRYIWKNPKTQLEALRDILRALPLDIGKIQWKSGAGLDV